MQRIGIILWWFISISLVFSQMVEEKEWENLLNLAGKSEYTRFLQAYQNMDFVLAEKTIARIFAKQSSNIVVIFSYLFISQYEGFGIEALEYGLYNNLLLYSKSVAQGKDGLANDLLRYVDNPRERLATLIEIESQLKYVNWLVRLEIIKEHVNRNKDYNAAMDKLSDLLTRYPNYPILHYYRLFFTLKQKDWTSFDSYASSALKLFPRHPEILRICAQAALERKKLQEAIAFYERGFQINSSWHADAFVELIKLYRENKQNKKALEMAQKGKSLYPWKKELGILEQQTRFGL
ncbi:tetratricopeptide repeat protein [Thermospira aquatica]|uniref:Tetratricopeptide repeat protein n=1 Tax=Thermospira aquatica TaxID=2828656 RepID=A0AAX3BFI2_9SPIR|nr:hypothetical protein [Thermospira aquatica]URA10824.1 hypothetical protein KDW03_03190 [Thermospira aquatica]